MKIYAMMGGLPRPSKPNLTNRRERKLKLTRQVHESGESFELGEYYMVIGTSALAGYEIDGVANIYALLRRWLTITENRYDSAKHWGIAELYVSNPRFIAYYDKAVPGCARFLRDAVAYWAKQGGNRTPAKSRRPVLTPPLYPAPGDTAEREVQILC